MTNEELQAITLEYRRDDRSRMGEVLTEVWRLREALAKAETKALIAYDRGYEDGEEAARNIASCGWANPDDR